MTFSDANLPAFANCSPRSPFPLFSLSLFSHHQVPGDEPPMIIQKREPINQQHRNQQCRDRKKKPTTYPEFLGFSLSSAHSQSNLYSSTKKKKKKGVSSSCPTLLSVWMYFSLHHERVKCVCLSAPSPAYYDLWAQPHCCRGDMY